MALKKGGGGGGDVGGGGDGGSDGGGSDGSLEFDTCVACGETIVVDYIMSSSSPSGYTIANCNNCDAMCCRECLEKYSTKDNPCCPKCVGF